MCIITSHSSAQLAFVSVELKLVWTKVAFPTPDNTWVNCLEPGVFLKVNDEKTKCLLQWPHMSLDSPVFHLVRKKNEFMSKLTGWVDRYQGWNILLAINSLGLCIDGSRTVVKQTKKLQMQLVPKVERTQVFSAETPSKLRVWHAIRRRIHLNYVDGRLENVWPRGFALLTCRGRGVVTLTS